MVTTLLKTLKAAREKLRFFNHEGRELTLMTSAFVLTCTNGLCAASCAVIVAPTTAGALCPWCGSGTIGEWQRISAVLERMPS